jgi:hypothetical protein
VVASAQVVAGGWLQVTPAHLVMQVPIAQTGALLPQLPQAAPLPPHCTSVCAASGTQVSPLQHPLHVVELQVADTSTHAPWLHCLPAAQVIV